MPRGRPGKLDRLQQERLCLLLASGTSRRTAATYLGCAVESIRLTAQRDPRFAEQLRQAEMQAELVPLNQVRKAAETNWRAATWILERLRPDRYARRPPQLIKEQHMAKFVDAVVEVILNEIDDAALREKIAARLEKLSVDASLELAESAALSAPAARPQRRRPTAK
ncbi:MAG TPA: hypothetical protein VFE24_05105 [Pirellulales bacterium]|jgi:hypothetical protein|nr:hypothetical protein [Pirellulales bacterium]